MLEITDKARDNEDYEDFSSIYANINNFLEENDIKDVFILAYKGKKFFIQNEVKIIENPNIVNHLGYEDTYLQKIDNHSIHSEKVRDYLVSLKDNFLSNIRETARQNFAERRKELQDNADKNVSVIKNMRR